MGQISFLLRCVKKIIFSLIFYLQNTLLLLTILRMFIDYLFKILHTCNHYFVAHFMPYYSLI